MNTEWSKSTLDEIHDRSSHHVARVLAAARCGCFSCCRFFLPTEIVEWCDKGQTAICPHCGIDAVLPEVGNDVLSSEMLDDMRKYWFSIDGKLAAREKVEPSK